MAIRVFIADDHKLFRVGLEAILGDMRNVEVVGGVGNGEELLQRLSGLAQPPHVVLLDLNMPKLNGIDTMAKLRTNYSNVRILVLSMYEGDNYIAQSIEGGACGYLHKNAEPEEIETAIESVYEKGYYFNDKTNKVMLHRMVNKKKLQPIFDNLNASFTDSELNVLRYICREHTSTEIAAKMYISKRTVEGIRTEMIRKLGVKNVVGLVLFAAKNNIIDL